MHDRLKPLYEAAREEAQVRREFEPLSSLESMIAEAGEVPSFVSSINNGDVAVIAEHKRRSPSQDDIRMDSDAAWRAEQYQRGGAMALSILTQKKHFGGSLDDLAEAGSASDLPLLRKDFISEEYQLYQARAYGAAAVLLIVGGLEQDKLAGLQDEARDIGLECLVEVHDKEELERAYETHPSAIGINNRDLTTMEVDTETTHHLLENIPRDVPVVAESGHDIDNPAHINELRRLHFNAVLVGTSLMRAPDPARAISNWLAA